MSKKIASRKRRSIKTRAKIKELSVARLTVNRTGQHTYAQIIAANGGEVLVSASTLDKDIRETIKHGGNVESAKLIGKAVAEKASKAGIVHVAFDRSGFKYHGRVAALADAARENGLKF
jgi:large subunit ribosomal protein L18